MTMSWIIQHFAESLCDMMSKSLKIESTRLTSTFSLPLAQPLLFYRIRGNTATKNKSRKREGKIAPRDLLQREIMRPGGREATPRDITCNCKSVSPKTLDPLYQK